MARRGRFYLSRVVKGGQLDRKNFVSAIQQAASVTVHSYSWTITNVHTEGSEPLYVYGKLAKFRPIGEVRVLLPEQRKEALAEEENLLTASSPFVYIPECSAIAGLHIWNQIEESTFRRRFSEIITESFEDFFVLCELEPIVDLSSFVKRLGRIRKITSITAKVSPPNPLFGHLWAELKTYLHDRRASELKVIEHGGDAGLASDLPRLAGLLEEGQEHALGEEPAASLGDAALLMASDGYGSGKVEGESTENEHVVIRTSDTVQSFLLGTDPRPEDLYAEARRHLEKLSRGRGWKHGG